MVVARLKHMKEIISDERVDQAIEILLQETMERNTKEGVMDVFTQLAHDPMWTDEREGEKDMREEIRNAIVLLADLSQA